MTTNVDLLDAHLGGCSECRDELKELLKFQSAIAENPPVEVTDRLLQEARQQLHLSLLEYRLRKPFWRRMVRWAQDVAVREYKMAFGGIGIAALGVFVGYLIFFQPQKVEEKTARIEAAGCRTSNAVEHRDRIIHTGKHKNVGPPSY